MDKTFSNSSSATGVGDVNLRLKYGLRHPEPGDARLKHRTGDTRRTIKNHLVDFQIQSGPGGDLVTFRNAKSIGRFMRENAGKAVAGGVIVDVGETEALVRGSKNLRADRFRAFGKDGSERARIGDLDAFICEAWIAAASFASKFPEFSRSNERVKAFRK